MMFAKANIYDGALKNIATRVFTHENQHNAKPQALALLDDFLQTVLTEIDTDNALFNLVIDYQCLSLLEKSKLLGFNKICLVVDKTQLERPELKNFSFIAYLVDNFKELALLPSMVNTLFINTSYLISDTEKVSQLASKYRLIATDVQQYSEYAKLKSLGVQFFIGNFIEKPEKVEQVGIPANKASMLNLISTLNKPDVELDEVSQVITADNILSYKLLRIVNSPIFRGMTELISIQEAVVRFGFVNLKKWVLMLSLCSVSDKPTALIKLALIRAIMCAQLADLKDSLNSDIAYTAGLLSTLDAFVDCSIEILVEETALTDDIKRAILFNEGLLGELLKSVIQFQHGKASSDEDVLTQAYIESVNQANEIFGVLGIAE